MADEQPKPGAGDNDGNDPTMPPGQIRESDGSGDGGDPTIPPGQ